MSWQTLTYFGDSMLLLPCAVVITIFLYFKTQDIITTVRWLVCFMGAGLIVSISKILFLGFFIGSIKWNFTGFSGHTTMSAVFWPIGLWIFSKGYRGLWCKLMLAIGYLLPITIGYSRLVLHAHSPSEVMGGMLLGLTISTLFIVSQYHVVFQPVRAVDFIPITLITIFILHYGHPATTQQFLAKVSAQLAGIKQPYSRQQLLN